MRCLAAGCGREKNTEVDEERDAVQRRAGQRVEERFNKQSVQPSDEVRIS